MHNKKKCKNKQLEILLFFKIIVVKQQNQNKIQVTGQIYWNKNHNKKTIVIKSIVNYAKNILLFKYDKNQWLFVYCLK